MTKYQLPYYMKADAKFKEPCKAMFHTETWHLSVIPPKFGRWARNQQSWSTPNLQDRRLKCFLTLFSQYMPGFKSRWIMLNLWRYWMPSRIDLIMSEISASLKLLLASKRYVISAFNVPPGMYYIMRYRLESVYLKELNFTTFLC